MKIAIRADGSQEIGYGHLVRTSVLANELQESSHELKYFTKTPGSLNKIREERYQVEKIETENEFTELLDKRHIDAVVTDSYDIDAELQKKIRSRCETYMAISDDTRFKFCCDILVNGNIYTENLDYRWKGEEPERLFGTDYVLLRKGFQRAAQENRSENNECNSAMITMGGSDKNNFTPKAMRALAEYQIQVTVIIGPGFQNKKEVREIAAGSEQFNLRENPENMAEIMKDSDIAVTATGSSTYELMAAQTPFVGIPQASNQNLLAESISDRKLGIISDEDQLSTKISKLASDSKLRQEIIRNQRKAVDGKGAKRLRKALES